MDGDQELVADAVRVLAAHLVGRHAVDDEGPQRHERQVAGEFERREVAAQIGKMRQPPQFAAADAELHPGAGLVAERLAGAERRKLRAFGVW